ncbi:MAG: DUF6057 family protein [Bacteroides sp.]|nr:DUF6057 family protein [Roseburia sp.]MCM1346691.1 DUF6057 family protein [Bacteroides sp.]MCM1419949.1 DUF6057 family protein [Bacteroides sp.]
MVQNNKKANTTTKPSFVSAPPQPKKQKKTTGSSFVLKSSFTNLFPYLFALLFGIYAFIMLFLKNSDYLYMVQEKSLFINAQSFFNECMSTPAGLLYWAGCYLTQFFYYPWLGSILLIVIWLATYFLLLSTFKIRREWSIVGIIPLVALLCSEISIGYWLYYIKIQGYWFAESLGFLAAILSAFIASRLFPKYRPVWTLIWTVAGYPLFGWYALLGTIYSAINGLLTKNGTGAQSILANPKTNAMTALIAIIGTPVIWYQFYTGTRIEDSWTAGFPLFQSDAFTSWLLALPFIVMAVIPLFAPLFRTANNKEQQTGIAGKQAYIILTATCLVGICSVAAVNTANFDNYNYHAEIRMYRAADEGDWQKVLEEAANLPGKATRQIVMFKNMALMHTGEMGHKMFHYDNSGEPPYVYDSLSVRMVQTAAPMIYYQYGKTNFAYRWCIENCVEFGFKVSDLKILTRCAILNGEYQLANKYINILKSTTFQGGWADTFLPMVKDPGKIAQFKEYENILPLRGYKDILDGDNGLCEMYLLNYFSNSSNVDPKFQEVTLNFAMINKNIQLFWPRFFQYATLHQGEEMPIHYQEAAFLYGTLEKGVDIKSMPFDKERVISRYAAFQQMSQSLLKQGMNAQQVGEAMKDIYGDTFWWFYFFCRDIKSY